jgi:hypothetical protein
MQSPTICRRNQWMQDMNQLVTRNEFSNELAAADTAATAVAAKAKALVEARYIMAMRNPRDMDVVRERLLKECRRPGFAKVARYIKPIGKDESKFPEGPSIRFAEAAIRCMGNVTVETMTTFDDREKRILNVVVTDLESNVPYGQDIVIAKTIERRHKKEGDVVISTRTNSYGDMLYILEGTDDDIANKQQALISKVIRTQGLRLVPGDIIDECMNQVKITQANDDAQDPSSAKRKLFDAFAEIGVRAEQLKDYLGHDAQSLPPRELADLRALYAAIRDGEATWRDVMDEREAKGKAATGLDAVKAASAAAKVGRAEKSASPRMARKDPAGDTHTPAPTASPAPAPFDKHEAAMNMPANFEAYATAIRQAPDSDRAAADLDFSRSVLSAAEHEQLIAIFRERWAP